MTTATTTAIPRPTLRRIGFIDPARAAAIQTAQRRPQAQVAQTDAPDTLLHFDVGETVSFLDASHNVMTLGTTGSGKTASVLLPAFDRLCSAGFGDIAVDSKGSLAPLLRTIARRHGRECGVVEIGPYEGATRLNLLAGRRRAEAAAILEPLLLGYCAHDTDRFWRMTGFEQFEEFLTMKADSLLLGGCIATSAPLGEPRLILERALVFGAFGTATSSASSGHLPGGRLGGSAGAPA